MEILHGTEVTPANVSELKEGDKIRVSFDAVVRSSPDSHYLDVSVGGNTVPAERASQGGWGHSIPKDRLATGDYVIEKHQLAIRPGMVLSAQDGLWFARSGSLLSSNPSEVYVSPSSYGSATRASRKFLRDHPEAEIVYTPPGA